MSMILRLKVRRKTLFNDLIAALVMASGTVPGSLANGVLAGTNPVYGVYSTIAGTTVLVSACQLCNIHVVGSEGFLIGVNEPCLKELVTWRHIQLKNDLLSGGNDFSFQKCIAPLNTRFDDVESDTFGKIAQR